MRVGIVQLREMVARAVRSAVTEARGKKRDIDPRTEKSAEAALARKLPTKDFRYSRDLNHYEPEEDELYKRQGASGIGGWTAESRLAIQKLIEMVVREELRSLRRR